MLLTKKIALIATILWMTAGCISAAKKDVPEGGAPFHDAAFDDHNRPPSKLSAPSELDSNSQNVNDPLYARTQADYHYSMGEAYSLDGDSAKAIESFKSVLLYDKESATVRSRIGTELLRQGKITESIEQFEMALEKNPKNTDAHFMLGGVYTTLKMYAKAIEQYNAVLKYEASHTDATLYKGAVLAEQKQYDLAIKQFEILLHNPEFAQQHLAHYYIARVRQEQTGEKYKKAAEAAFLKSIDAKPDFADAVIGLGEFYRTHSQEDKMLKLLSKFQKERGPNSRIAETLSQIYLEKAQFDLAYEQLSILEAVNENSINVKLKMALILIEKKDFNKAITKLEDILIEVPDSDKVRFYLGAVFEELKQDDKAVTNFKKVPANSSFYSESVIHASYLLKRKGNVSEAIFLVEKAIDQVKDQFNLYAMYASLLDEKGDYDKAITILEKGLKQFPNSAQMRFFYGTIQDRIGNKDKVIPEMRKVVEIDPKHVQGLNYLAYTLAEIDSELDDAEGFAQRALVLEPKDGFIMDTLGWILFKKGKYGDATRYLEAANKAQPNVSVIAEHLGDAYLKLAMVEKAIKMYNKAVDLEKDTKKVREIKLKMTAVEQQSLAPGRTPAALSDK